MDDICAQLRKIELANQIARTNEEFVDYLMAIENDLAIEEFFNKCHDAKGRFCETSGDRKPDPVGYVKQRASAAIETKRGRSRSAEVQRVTTGATRRGLGLLTQVLTAPVQPGLGASTAYGSVKVRKLSKTNLKNFTDDDLGTLTKQLKSDQRRYNLMNSVGWANVAVSALYGASGKAAAGTIAGGPYGAAVGATAGLAMSATMLGLSRWKTKRIPGQIDRINRELKSRKSGGGSLSSENLVEFASDDDNLPSLAEEIAAAKKEIEAMTIPKSPPKMSATEAKEVRELLEGFVVDEEEGVTAEMIKNLKKAAKLLK